MTETNTATTPTETTAFDPPQPGDPRFAYATVTQAVGDLMAAVTPDQLTAATPCPEFTVKELLEHLVLVQRRVAAIGNGDLWSNITEDPVDAGWHDDFRSASHDVMAAWGDPAKLEQMWTVPWGQLPGAPMILCYVGELAVHGWDLAHATGLPFELDASTVRPALEVAQFGMPAGARADEQVPFGPVVDPGPDASILLQLAGWFGRDVKS